MPYIPQRKTYTLNFAGTALDGLIVTMTGLSIGEYLEMQKLQGLAQGETDDTDSLVGKFVDHLIEWNVTTETGVAVTPNMKSVSGLDVDFVLEIINAWIRAISGVSAPLESSSTSGQPSLEDSIQTVSLSPSLAS